MLKLTKKTFSGNSKIFDGTLASILMDQRRVLAQMMINGVTPLTDSTGGVAASSLVDIPAYTAFTAGTTDAVAKAEYETTLAVIRQNLAREVLKLQDLWEKYPLVAEPQMLISGTDGNTLDAVDDVMTGTSTGGSLAALAGVNANLATTLSRMKQLAHLINIYAVDLGVTPITDNIVLGTGVADPRGSVNFQDISVATGTASTGANTISKAAADVKLDQLADNLATLADKLNDIIAKSPAFAA